MDPALMIPKRRRKRFAAHDGNGTGTLADPYSLTDALTKGNVKPGETLYLRAGTYQYPRPAAYTVTGYAVSLQGARSKRITIRPYPGERVIIDGGIRSNDTAGSYPQYVTIRDLEVIVSENLTESRTSTSNSEADLNPVRPRGGVSFVNGESVWIINNYIHDNTVNGIGWWNGVKNGSLLYGNVVCRNGYIGSTDKHGHGFYTQNGSGHTDWKTITNNIFYDNYMYAGQMYGTGAVIDYYTYSKNIHGIPSSGSVSGNGNVVLGNKDPATGYRVYDNRGNKSAQMPQSDSNAIADVICTGNVVVGIWYIQDGREYTNYEFSDNYCYGNIGGSTQWWKLIDDSGDGPTTYTQAAAFDPGTPADAKLATLYTNAYDSTRAHVFCAKIGGGSVNLTVTGFLGVGDTWELRDPLDLFGDAVQNGTCSGSTIALTLANDTLIGVLMKT